jgi:hypothetical protein
MGSATAVSRPIKRTSRSAASISIDIATDDPSVRAGRGGPRKPKHSTVKPLGKDPPSAGLVPEQLHAVVRAVAEQIQIPAQRIPPQMLPHHRGQSVERSPQVGWLDASENAQTHRQVHVHVDRPPPACALSVRIDCLVETLFSRIDVGAISCCAHFRRVVFFERGFLQENQDSDQRTQGLDIEGSRDVQAVAASQLDPNDPLTAGRRIARHRRDDPYRHKYRKRPVNTGGIRSRRDACQGPG